MSTSTRETIKKLQELRLKMADMKSEDMEPVQLKPRSEKMDRIGNIRNEDRGVY